jgi:hypothetical protein
MGRVDRTNRGPNNEVGQDVALDERLYSTDLKGPQWTPAGENKCNAIAAPLAKSL